VRNRVGYLSKVASRYSSRPEMSTNAILQEEICNCRRTKRKPTDSMAWGMSGPKCFLRALIQMIETPSHGLNC